eukprot:8686_1
MELETNVEYEHLSNPTLNDEKKETNKSLIACLVVACIALVVVSIIAGIYASQLNQGSGEKTLEEGFVYLSHIDDSIQQNVRYFGQNNFVGNRIPGYKKGVCVITAEAAAALSKAQKQLKEKDANLSLKVYDAYRPQKAVDYFMKWSHNTSAIKMKDIFYPAIEDKTDLFKRGYIAEKSGHTRGSTVDLTIVDLRKSKDVNSTNMADNSINMGSIFDFFGVQSHYENDVITDQEAKDNRKFLHEVMMANGFNYYPQEWWHFTLANEPFKDKYFDFDIQ